MSLLPAPPNTGICFRRVDLEGRPEIQAHVENVFETTRSTTLAKGKIKLHTVEHILAAFSGYGIDNAFVELDANEPPIGDGSAREYSRLIKASGSRPQAEDREPFVLLEPLGFQIGESIMAVFPHDSLRISCTSSDQSGSFTQFYSVEVSPESWEREISEARTFCFFEEIECLIQNGLIKGGSLENAVIIRDDVVLTNEPLRFPEEFVRHKVLDIIGDLALIGRPLHAHVIAIKPSHKANCELACLLAQKIRQPAVAARAFAPPPLLKGNRKNRSPRVEPPAEGGTELDTEEVMKILPHRYPFLMIDRVTRMESMRITAIKNITLNEPYFQGHFPDRPIMPGVLQLEAIAQAAGMLTLNTAENWGKIAYFMSAESVKWRRPVKPGDSLVIEVEMMKSRGKIGKARGVCSVGGEEVSEAVVTFMLVDA